MVIGLMGGVGSGKSTVLDFFANKYDAEIIQTDHVAKEMMAPGKEPFDEINKAFPYVIEDGIINNTKLAEVVFSDKVALNKLNSITHPATINETIKRINESNKKYVVVESALLIGTGIEEHCDELWTVVCDKETRINRLISDRGYSREKAESIISNQMSDDEFMQYADVVIDNSNSTKYTYEQIVKNLKNNLKSIDYIKKKYYNM